MYNPHEFNNYVRRILNQGLSLSEVDLGDLKRESTKHGPSLMEVDWGEKFKPNYTSSGCMLMQLDWGGKLKVNHINECMSSEVNWGAHEPIKMDTALVKLIGEVMIQVFTLWMDVCAGAHDSSFFLYLVHIDHDAKPKDFFTQVLYHKGHLPPLL